MHSKSKTVCQTEYGFGTVTNHRLLTGIVSSWEAHHCINGKQMLFVFDDKYRIRSTVSFFPTLKFCALPTFQTIFDYEQLTFLQFFHLKMFEYHFEYPATVMLMTLCWRQFKYVGARQ